MKASELTSMIKNAELIGPDCSFKKICADSRLVGPGDAFIALPGSTCDGKQFIGAAIEAGASLIIGNASEAAGTTLIKVENPQAALNELLPKLYPGAAEVFLIGITGTNGKTSTTYLLESILEAAGIKCGVIGTINTRFGGRITEASLTTPGSIELFEILDEMHAEGVTHCIMEVSSHALDQGRPAGLKYSLAIFTNLSQDHLDYHADMQRYFMAKQKLFTDYLAGPAIINTDDEYGQKLIDLVAEPVSYGSEMDCDVQVTTRQSDGSGIRLRVETVECLMDIESDLQGAFHIYNILAAVAAAMSLDIDSGQIREGIRNLSSIPGRMQQVANKQGLNILIDFAHTPDALQKALENARELATGRLLTVFGCGGDRDKTKRPIMGRIASELADITIITSDNPRTEAPMAIIDEIKSGITDTSGVTVMEDRAAAIRHAISIMNRADCLVIAGKGHENYQIIGQTRMHFDDAECVQASLKEVR